MWIYRQTFSLINCWSVNISLKKFQSSCFCLQIFQWLTPLNAFCQDRCCNCSMSNCRLIIFLKGKLNKKYFLGFGAMPAFAFIVKTQQCIFVCSPFPQHIFSDPIYCLSGNSQYATQFSRNERLGSNFIYMDTNPLKLSAQTWPNPYFSFPAKTKLKYT